MNKNAASERAATPAQALSELKPFHRTLLWLAHVEKLAPQQIGEHTGLTVKTAREMVVQASQSLPRHPFKEGAFETELAKRENYPPDAPYEQMARNFLQGLHPRAKWPPRGRFAAYLHHALGMNLNQVAVEMNAYFKTNLSAPCTRKTVDRMLQKSREKAQRLVGENPRATIRLFQRADLYPEAQTIKPNAGKMDAVKNAAEELAKLKPHWVHLLYLLHCRKTLTSDVKEIAGYYYKKGAKGAARNAEKRIATFSGLPLEEVRMALKFEQAYPQGEQWKVKLPQPSPKKS